MRNKILEVQKLGFPWHTSDPFLFCVHHEDYYPEGNENMGPTKGYEGRLIGNDFTIKDGYRMYHGRKVPGFPAHPHCGFETVTVVRKGLVDHSDSMGAAGRFGFGDVQWMTAGRGVQHCEMFPLKNKDKPNTLELFQIWLNLPKASKLVDPHFKMLWSEDIPVITKNGVTVELIAGEMFEQKAPEPAPNSWAANPQNEIAIMNIKMDPNSKFTLPSVSSNTNRTIYLYRGKSITIDGIEINNYHSAKLKADENVEIGNGNEEVWILLLQGKPINEPVFQHGPFVMNHKHELIEVIDRYQKDEFGGWPWQSPENVHDRDSGRFALHSDGKKEVKS